ncbi:MAG TPA: hypothetical protein VM346_04220 [Sphingomicrobium sp.]|nr:hypothetical protein [Sphingomicrobium sp.]
MAINRALNQGALSAAEAHLARVADTGCGRHPHLAALVDGAGAHSARDLADAVHLLCSLHGRHPGMIEIALGQCAERPLQAWLSRAADAFERERLYLVRLTSAVGPLPSTPGAAETEASLLAARHALETLARSERNGCALGAAAALVGDWWPIRRLLDRAAHRAGIECPAPSMPDEASVVEVIDRLSDSPAGCRALAFGSEQLLLQHRALFDLLEARASARDCW